MKILKKQSLTLYLTIPPSKDSQYDVVMELASGSTDMYVVYGLNGRRGAATTRQLKTKVPVDFPTAERVWNQLLKDKRDKKGYTTDVSGAAYGGVSMAGVDKEYAAAPVPDRLLAAVEQPQPWESTSAKSFEAALCEGNRTLQIRPAGTRVLVATSVTSQVAATVSETGQTTIRNLPERLKNAIHSLFRNWVLDGVLEAGEFTVMDGYPIDPGHQHWGIVTFETRASALQNLFRERVLPHATAPDVLKLQPVFSEDSAAEAACWFAGSQAVLRLPGMPYLYDLDDVPQSVLGTL